MSRISGIQVIGNGFFGGTKKTIATIPLPVFSSVQDKVTATVFIRVVGETTIGYKVGSIEGEQSVSSSPDETGQAKLTLEFVRNSAGLLCMVDCSMGGPAYEGQPSGPLAESVITGLNLGTPNSLVITGLGAGENVGIVVDVDAHFEAAA